ncbi:N-formimino-L-glutamate deiminase [compost metagenome]
MSIFRWQRVRRQAGGFHFNRQQFAQLARHAQHFQLAFRRQPVAGFDLHAGHAFRQQRSQPEQRLLQQQFFVGVTGGLDGGNDATALGGDIGVAYAVEALLEFAATVATEHQMGMAVDKARRDDTAVEFHGFIRYQVCR